MRVLLPVVILLALSFAGCSGKKGNSNDDDELHADCPDGTVLHGEDFPAINTTEDLMEECPDDGGNDDDDDDNNTTPNQPPTLVLKSFDAPGGNESNVTMVGGSFTFSAEGSSDPDGTIAGIAITVDDGNRTRTLTLYAGGQFIPQTVVFDRPGIVNVTAAMVDDRAAFAILESNVYVNEAVSADTRQYPAGNPANHDALRCAGPNSSTANGDVIDNTYSQEATLIVADNASFIEVYVVEGGNGAGSNGQIDFAICSPEGTPISTEGTSNTNGPTAPLISTNTERLPGSSDYYIFFISRVPQSLVTYTATIHYEPMAAAPPA